jgi:hypothetical protein
MRICQEFEDANDAITLSKTYLTLHADQVRDIPYLSYPEERTISSASSI